MRIAAVAAASLVSLLICAAASAGPPYYEDGGLEDSVTGTDRPGGDRWEFDAHSDSSGGNPRGTVSLTGPGVAKPDTVAEVTCLAVTGNRAVIGLIVRKYSLPVFWIVEDNGSGTEDTYEMLAGIDTNGYSCANPPLLTLWPLIAPDGDLVVADDQPIPVTARSSRCGKAARRATASQRRRCAKIRRAKAGCIRKAQKAKPKAKVQRRVRACRRVAARRSRA